MNLFIQDKYKNIIYFHKTVTNRKWNKNTIYIIIKKCAIARDNSSKRCTGVPHRKLSLLRQII